jgi:anti-sigma regulatory factor (Ser/Thr protein kinase)
MLMLEYKGPEEAEELEIEARTDNLDEVLGFLEKHLERWGCPMKVQTKLNIAAEEIYVNIASYAYGAGEGKATIRFDYDPAARRVILSFIDEGVPFNPLESDEPDVSLSAEERAIGGLGIFLVKKTMDSIKYRYENGQNILTIEKQI